jgi:hypothetical protein
MKLTKNVTIGKILLSIIAIGVMFVPVYAVQSIEARAIDHALAVEGLYINGTAIDILDFSNETMEQVETYYHSAEVNITEGADSVVYLNAGGVNQDLLYRDRATYLGNGSYAMTYNISEEAGTIMQRYLFIPLDLNATEFMTSDFYRITSDWDYPPQIIVLEALSFYEIGTTLEVSEDNYIFVNTIQTRSELSQHEDSQIFLYYNAYTEPEVSDWSVKIQSEVYEGADILTWTDETLYIMAVMLCDILLVGAIVFASDPIDIQIDRPKRKR